MKARSSSSSDNGTADRVLSETNQVSMDRKAEIETAFFLFSSFVYLCCLCVHTIFDFPNKKSLLVK